MCKKTLSESLPEKKKNKIKNKSDRFKKWQRSDNTARLWVNEMIFSETP